VIVNIQRGGPGLGNITASQADYFQAVKGGGHVIITALSIHRSTCRRCGPYPSAFDKADQYRTPVMILGDGVVGQMMEPFHRRSTRNRSFPKRTGSWTVQRGEAPGYPIPLDGTGELEQKNMELQKKYDLMKKKEVMYETHDIQDATLIVVGLRHCSRIAFSAIKEMRREGKRIGLFRPITLSSRFLRNSLRTLQERTALPGGRDECRSDGRG